MTDTGVTEGRPRIVGPDAGPETHFPSDGGQVISGFAALEGARHPHRQPPRRRIRDPLDRDVRLGRLLWLGLDRPARGPPQPPQPNPRRSADAAAPLPPLLYPMVMSIGYNPFYKNTVRSAEVHVLHPFAADFYDAHMRLLLLGFVREEKDYKSLEALVEDIRFDCTVARESLRRSAWCPPREDALRSGEGAEARLGDGEGTLDVSWLLRALE
ncbi:riboflavin kinase [Verticillium alfalfae VaMs.102]|uniref:Riboflavin kinase n=1 Tax=Verticillium alfalfae (strain VaMs.102 / ATCC MYA-4576 / FGSC 10136) TaxID=526221 RepID=C9ST62_VERA1|nr:riboflavin kinase [Verticillium alfalfae VaMs.102]EEY21977.1 riboflavin kinase [Verticillium alfalfae VaMs.102]